MIGLAFGALSTLGTIGQFAGNLLGAGARRAQMNEQIRATEIQKAQTVGIAAARSGASGVEMTSTSTQEYLKGLGAEFDRTIRMQRKARNTTFIASLFGAGAGLAGGAASTIGGLNNLNPSDNSWSG